MWGWLCVWLRGGCAYCSGSGVLFAVRPPPLAPENGLWRRILPVGGAVPPSPRSYMTVAVVGTRLFLYGTRP